jgi:hypothetical protein
VQLEDPDVAGEPGINRRHRPGGGVEHLKIG